MSRTLLGETPESVLEVLAHALDAFEASEGGGRDRCDLTREGIARGVQLARSCGTAIDGALEGRLARLGVAIAAAPPPEAPPPPEAAKTVAEVAAALRAENPDFVILDAPAADRSITGHAPLRITCTE